MGDGVTYTGGFLSLGALCGTPRVDTREFHVDLVRYWQSHVQKGIQELESLEHLLYHAKTITEFTQTIFQIIVDCCIEDDCWANGFHEFPRGICRGNCLAYHLRMATSALNRTFQSLLSKIQGVRHYVGRIGSYRQITNRYVSRVRHITGEMVDLAMLRPVCHEPALSNYVVCRNVLRKVTDMSQNHLFRFHALLINWRGRAGFRHASPRPRSLRYVGLPGCENACRDVHGHAAEAVLRGGRGARAREDGRVHAVEIGTYLGETALQLLKRVPELNLIMVDPFEDAKLSAEAEARIIEDGDATDGGPDSGDGIASSSDTLYPYNSTAYEEVHTALAPYRNRSLLVKQESKAAGAWMKDEFFDAIIIDGDHSYQGCTTDVVTWCPKLRRGPLPGAMVFHDYSVEFPGVIRCVHEAAAANSRTCPVSDGKLWLGPGFTAWFFAMPGA